MTKPQGQQPQQSQAQQGQSAAGAAQTQQSGQQLEHALQQHAQAHGLSLSGVNWAAVTAAILQLIQALTQGGQQPSPTP